MTATVLSVYRSSALTLMRLVENIEKCQNMSNDWLIFFSILQRADGWQVMPRRFKDQPNQTLDLFWQEKSTKLWQCI